MQQRGKEGRNTALKYDNPVSPPNTRFGVRAAGAAASGDPPRDHAGCPRAFQHKFVLQRLPLPSSVGFDDCRGWESSTSFTESMDALAKTKVIEQMTPCASTHGETLGDSAQKRFGRHVSTDLQNKQLHAAVRITFSRLPHC